MARKTPEESERTRARILEAAVQVFHERGVARPSLTDVAAAIGMTRGAVYGHFRNKSEVLVALFDREELPWESLVDDADPRLRADPMGVLRADLVRLLQMACEDAARARALNVLFYKVELAVENAALVARIQAARERSFLHLRALLARAAAAGQLGAGREPEADARFLMMSAFGAIMEWLWAPGEFDLHARAERYVDDWLRPLRA